MKIRMVAETCIYSSDLDGMKTFCVGILGLPLLQEKGKFIFLQVGKSMLLILDSIRTSIDNDKLPPHSAQNLPAILYN